MKRWQIDDNYKKDYNMIIMIVNNRSVLFKYVILRQIIEYY